MISWPPEAYCKECGFRVTEWDPADKHLPAEQGKLWREALVKGGRNPTNGHALECSAVGDHAA